MNRFSGTPGILGTARVRRGLRRTACVAALLAASAIAACHEETPAQPVATLANTTPPPYTLRPGDELEFRFFYTPQMNEREFIFDSGDITLPLLANVHVAGLTVPQLHDLLIKTYVEKGILKDPDIEVLLRTSSVNNRVFVGGEVVTQGAVPLVAPTPLSRAVILAQGLKPTAYSSQILLIRHLPDGGQTVLQVNYAKIMKGKAPDQDILLQPGDVIFVPQSPIAKVDDFVTNYIKNVVPNLGFGLNYELNPSQGSTTVSTP